MFREKLFERLASMNFSLADEAEKLIFENLENFLKKIVLRAMFFARHRIDVKSLSADRYEMKTNSREQIRFLVDLQKNEKSLNVPPTEIEENFRRTKDFRASIVEQMRKKEAEQTASIVLREIRTKKQNETRRNFLRVNLQDLIAVLETESIFRRSKLLLFAYANR